RPAGPRPRGTARRSTPVTEPGAPGARDAVIGRYSGLARTALAGGVITDCDPGAFADGCFGAAAYGLDASPDMLTLARANATQAGVTNARFLHGHIEDIPLPGGHVDVVMSNCVINLSTDKP